MKGLDVHAHVPLAALATLGVGGPAQWFATVGDIDAVAAADRWSRDRGLPLTVLGGGSNVVIADEGIRGLVARIDIRGVRSEPHGDGRRLTTGAGETWDTVVRTAVDQGLAGVECLSGIPGLVGGTPIQNVGAYGQVVEDTIEAVVAYDRSRASTVTLSSSDCEFEYRSSRFKREDAGRFIVCEIVFAMRPGFPCTAYDDISAWLASRAISTPTVRDVREAVLDVRRRKGMVVDAADPDSRSVGSFFMNPVITTDVWEALSTRAGRRAQGFQGADGTVKVSAAWLIEQSGLRRGEGEGVVGLSTKHTLAVVNRGGATARDVVRFAATVKRRVGEHFGVWLRPEPVFLGFDPDPELAFLQRTR